MRTKDNLFRPTKSESKADSTTRAAKEIIDAQKTARDAITQRLRLARLEREASEKAQTAAAPKTKAPRKSRSKAG